MTPHEVFAPEQIKEVFICIPAPVYLLVARYNGRHDSMQGTINLSIHLTKSGAEKERELMIDKFPIHILEFVTLEIKE